MQQGVAEVDHQPEHHDSGQRIVEDQGNLLQPVAGERVGEREREKADPGGEHEKIQHGIAPESAR